jgi:putative nucleotidyltransferase with HDIG domain
MQRAGGQDAVAYRTTPTSGAPASLWDKLSSGNSRKALNTAFVVLQILVGLAIFAWQAPQFSGDLVPFVFLAGLCLLAERMPISIYGDTQLSVGFVLTMAIIALFGAPGVAIVAPFEAVASRYGRYPLDYFILRSAGRNVITHAAAAAAYGVIADVNPRDLDATLAIGAAFATSISFCLAAAFVTLSVSLRTGQRLTEVWERQRWTAPHYAAMGVLGAALAGAYLVQGMVGMLVFMVPGIMMRLVMKQYVDKTAENVQKLKEQNVALSAANVEIRRVSNELQVSYDGTLEALVNALDARDQETKGHSLRVSHYMMDIARELGVKENSQQWIDMQRGSLLHDVGKIGVSDTILLKPGKLTDDEWELMRKHPEIGYQMLRQVQFLQGAAEIILGHHERWDGAGYPRGLKADEIPLGSRIFPVVDTFDSMTSDRPYRKAKTTLEAMNEILRCSGSQFDPLVVEAFLDIYQKWVHDRDELHQVSAASAVRAA